MSSLWGDHGHYVCMSNVNITNTKSLRVFVFIFVASINYSIRPQMLSYLNQTSFRRFHFILEAGYKVHLVPFMEPSQLDFLFHNEFHLDEKALVAAVIYASQGFKPHGIGLSLFFP